MLNIFLCEDDKIQLFCWKKWIENYLLMRDEQMRLAAAVSEPLSLLTELLKVGGTGIYFLDIDLKDKMNGLELAQEIRKYDPRGYIVFVTTHSEMAALTYRYKVEALDFIIKDEPDKIKDRLEECIAAAEENYRKTLTERDKLFSLKYDKTVCYVNQDDILFISSLDTSHKLAVYMTDEVKQLPGSLKGLLSGLNENFCFCSQSSIVNIGHVKEYQKRKRLLVMDNGSELSVSVRRVKEVERRLGLLG